MYLIIISNHSEKKGPFYLEKKEQKEAMWRRLHVCVCYESVQVSHTRTACVCWLTWYIAISHFTFFSNSFVRASSNLSVASLVDACSFFISVSRDCNYRVHRWLILIADQKLIIFLVMAKQSCECFDCNTFLYFSFSSLRSLVFFSYSLWTFFSSSVQWMPGLVKTNSGGGISCGVNSIETMCPSCWFV